MRNWK